MVNLQIFNNKLVISNCFEKSVKIMWNYNILEKECKLSFNQILKNNSHKVN